MQAGLESLIVVNSVRLYPEGVVLTSSIVPTPSLVSMEFLYVL